MKGAIAKENVENKIKECFGSNFVGIQDKKLYVWADDGGEMVQIAISMTCPKIGIESSEPAPAADSKEKGDWDWTGTMTTVKPDPVKLEVSEEEKENIKSLMERLGL